MTGDEYKDPLLKSLYFRNRTKEKGAKADITVGELQILLARCALNDVTTVEPTVAEYPTRTIGDV